MKELLLNPIVKMVLVGIWETLYMTVVSTFYAYIIGLPVGTILVLTADGGLYPMKALNSLLNFAINFIRSVPFLILLVAVIPFTRKVAGTTLGYKPTVVPLVIASAPFISRVVESSLNEVDKGMVEAAESMGASIMQIVMKVLLPESLPSLVTGASIAMTTILGYSALAGFTGGGGLGDIATRYGYYRRRNDIMSATVILLVLIVQIFQQVGFKLAFSRDKRK
ncbi:MAG: ABC transporter permease [Eubacteriaceae bacterium]|nr:ABC transporter permease [Eubacteriaceae bacterium]